MISLIISGTIVIIVITFFCFCIWIIKNEQKSNESNSEEETKVRREIWYKENLTGEQKYLSDLLMEFDIVHKIKLKSQIPEKYNNRIYKKTEKLSEYGKFLCLKETYTKKEMDKLKEFCVCGLCEHNPFNRTNEILLNFMYWFIRSLIPGNSPTTFGCLKAKGIKTHRADLVRLARIRMKNSNNFSVE